jgi:hypothetical protein
MRQRVKKIEKGGLKSVKDNCEKGVAEGNCNIATVFFSPTAIYGRRLRDYVEFKFPFHFESASSFHG